MGFLERLFGGRFTQPPPDEPPLSDAAIMRELHPFRCELKVFTQSLLTSGPLKVMAMSVSFLANDAVDLAPTNLSCSRG